jgi:hypothetical protein
MSSIRTVEHLSDAMSREVVWRKKELTALRWLIESSSTTEDRRGAVLRGAIALLYAHWEGFIKAASRAYLEFVQFQRLPYNQLAPNFVALGARAMLYRAAHSSRPRVHQEVVEFFFGRLGDRAVLPYKEGLSAQSNLSSGVLRDITDSLGLDYSEFETKERLLDDLLLRQRNTIAHGEYLTLTQENYLSIHEQVLWMMEAFRTQIDNAAALRRFKAAGQPNCRCAVDAELG